MSYTPSRLHIKGAILGYRRSKVVQYDNQSLIKINGVNSSQDAEFYFGKRVAFVYKAETVKDGSRYRSIWGKVTKAHGTNGVVRCHFRHNLPPTSMGKTIRVMLYPSQL